MMRVVATKYLQYTHIRHLARKLDSPHDAMQVVGFRNREVGGRPFL
jgi:hypothetical protein